MCRTIVDVVSDIQFSIQFVDSVHQAQLSHHGSGQARIPERIVEKAIVGMLPKNSHGRELFRHLKVRPVSVIDSGF